MNIKNKEQIKNIFDIELSQFRLMQHSNDKWAQLERLHIIGQMIILLHYKVHFMMLKLAVKENKKEEVLGQILRICLVLPAHLVGLLPLGNTGTSRVNAFKKMELPADLKYLLSKSSPKDREN